MRYMETTFASLLRTIAPSFITATMMFGALYLIAPHIATLHIVLRLSIIIGAGGVVYLLLAWAFRLRALSECLSILKGVLAKSE
jgi:hypothetical protein